MCGAMRAGGAATVVERAMRKVSAMATSGGAGATLEQIERLVPTTADEPHGLYFGGCPRFPSWILALPPGRAARSPAVHLQLPAVRLRQPLERVGVPGPCPRDKVGCHGFTSLHDTTLFPPQREVRVILRRARQLARRVGEPRVRREPGDLARPSASRSHLS